MSVLSLAEVRADWQPLFNGKDLAKWSGDPRIWRVENGVIIGESNADDKKVAAKGVIALQIHAGPAMKAEFKNLRLLETPDPPPATPTAEGVK